MIPEFDRKHFKISKDENPTKEIRKVFPWYSELDLFPHVSCRTVYGNFHADEPTDEDLKEIWDEYIKEAIRERLIKVH